MSLRSSRTGKAATTRAVATRTIHSWQQDAGPRRRRDPVSVEEPLEIRIDTVPASVTMRTPGHDAELAVGFLAAEGILTRADQLLQVRPYARNRQGNVIDVHLEDSVVVDFQRLTRHVVASSSCGLCGKATIEALRRPFPKVTSRIRFEAGMLLRLPDRMRREQSIFQRTGGLHAAALFDAAGQLLVLREDVGRHNAVDKILGWALLNGSWPPARAMLMVSGRVSFEIMQKALAGRVPLVAAVSAPSSLAIELACAHGQTLVGFLRGDSLNVYAGVRRIRFPKAGAAPPKRQP